MSRGRDVERYAFEMGEDPSTVSTREARAYTAQIAWNRMMRRLAKNGHDAVPQPVDDAAEIAAGRAHFWGNAWANEIWRLYKHPPNLYAKFMQAIEKGTG